MADPFICFCLVSPVDVLIPAPPLHIDGQATAGSWLDLRKQDDYDGRIFAADVAAGALTLVLTLSQVILCLALDCTANAEDTLKQQERGMHNQRAVLGCG